MEQEKLRGNADRYYAGIDAGSVSVNGIVINQDREVVYEAPYKRHLGKVDEGGGGTVAKYLAVYGMDIIDCGPPMLSMHSPYEVTSKVDLYEAYRAYRAFFATP